MILKILRILSLFVPVFFSVVAQANIVGTELQNFNPTSSGLDFVTVHSSDTLEPGVLNMGIFGSYAVNSLPFYRITSSPTNQKLTEPNDRLFASDIHLGLGIAKGWDIGFNTASVVSQDIDDSTQLGTFDETGVADIRLNTKVRFYKKAKEALAFVASLDFERVRNNPFSGEGSGPAFNFEFIWDRWLTKKWRWGLNLGYRLRDEGTAIATTGITPIRDQITYSSALSYLLRDYDSHLMFELFGSLPTEETSTPTDRKMHNLQGLVGWRWNYTKRLDFHFGAGAEIYHGLSTPDILAYLGVNWRLGPIWSLAKDSDKDGVLDEDDLCPGTRKSERNLVNGDGCADSDGDGVYNNLDECPDTPKGRDVNDRGCSLDFEAQPNYNVDFDGDGVYNDEDECPDTPRGTKVNDLGCAVERVKNITLKNINFYTGTAKMVKASRKSFNKAVRDLLEIKSTIKKVIVEGHTDSVGKRAMNQRLSQFRANTIRKLLISEVGFSKSQVRAVGHGEDRPVATNKTKKGRLKNRRVELRLIRHK